MAEHRHVAACISMCVCTCTHVWARVHACVHLCARVRACALTCRFRASLKHKDDGQTKFIKLNSQRYDIIIKYCVSIGSIHREQG